MKLIVPLAAIGLALGTPARADRATATVVQHWKFHSP